jgi:DNA-binding beta-propeller fold protein YncE
MPRVPQVLVRMKFRLRQLTIIMNVWILVLCSDLTSQSPEGQYTLQFHHTFPEGPVAGLSLSDPQALSIDGEGNVLVADTGNHRLLKFDSRGLLQFTAGGFGWEKEQFDRPLDVTMKTGLDLYVADYNNERIERYDRELNYIASLYSDESSQPSLQFGFPTGVDISRHSELFICDNENNRILKLDAFGEPALSFGDYNWGDGQLEHPVKLEVTDRDLIYVSDQGSDQIVIFDYHGNYVTRFGKGLLQDPAGLAFSAAGLLFVADSGNHRVVVFDSRHRVVFSWGQLGDGVGAFKYPIDVDTYGSLTYVLDPGNERIQIFDLLESSN